MAARPKKTDYAALSGIADDTLEARTGSRWEKWVKALDHRGAAELPHRAIVDIVRAEFGVGDWWAQSVTVGYERIKGLREIGQRRAGSYEASRSKTFSVPVATLFAACADARQRARWLKGLELTVRTATPSRSMRITWADGTSVEMWFQDKAADKSSLQVQHVKLGSKADAEARKAFWSERLDALAALLAK
ncbi:MAG: hypothetical protein NDJ94_10145 [Vicinamibacteria bacterium]|nr:hypothetical protein [Vicinamibacteria bacterium]